MTNCNGCVNLCVENTTNIHYCKLDNTFCKVENSNKLDMLPNGVAKIGIGRITPEKDCNKYESNWGK